MRCGTAYGLQQHKARNEYPCKFCIRFRDNPTKTPAPKPELASKPAKNKRPRATPNAPQSLEDIKHGSIWGYTQHRLMGDPYCAECKEAKNAEQRARYKPSTRVLVRCGTPQGLRKHQRNQEPACDLCESVRKVRQLKPSPCGTERGHTRHVKEGTPRCEPCRVAHNKYQKETAARRKGQR